MELKVSSPKQGLSPTDCVSDPDEKEISEDDDDDRNHKHRRREEPSQSLEGTAPEHVFTRPYRKRNKPFENGHSFGEGGSQSSETWKNYSIANQEKELSGRFERRRQNAASFSRSSNDSNIRMRVNHSISADQGSIRGRGREPGSWSQRDTRFSSGDIASQLVQQGSVPPNLFAGRGLPNVSSVQSASWSAFGLVPAIPNGGLDTLHSIGLQGSLRPPMNPSVNLVIPRQRCRDFEERGFCLRGDICPMEHGVNRIVVEDVQSLSQFNLPVSLPGAHLLGTPAAQGHLSANTSSSTFTNNKSVHNKSSKSGMPDDGLGLNVAFVSNSSVVGAADLYDPDQPLWNDCPETSPALLALNPSNIDEADTSLDARPSDRHLFGHCDGSDNERSIKNGGTAAGSQSSSVWGRIGGSKSRSDVREKIDSALSSSNLENEMKIDADSVNGSQVVARQGRRSAVDGVGTEVMGLSLKQQSDSGRNTRKSSQKALRTLFVNGIPHKENKRETLLSHFQKFGEVIDIYIPLNSERAFVQFSKREEAEAALKAPDAVMGNRFIKLWWANRDSVPDDGVSGMSNVPVNSRSVTPLGPSYPWTTKGKDNAQTSGPKVNITHASVTSVPASDHPKPMVTNGPKGPPPLQKKLEKLALLKEVQKKQEMLAKKRDEFMRQLDKLAKQANSLKDEVPSDQQSKRHKAETVVVDVAKDEIWRSSDSGTVVSPQQVELTVGGCRPAESTASQSSKLNSCVPLPEPSSLKPSIRPLAPLGVPFVVNRFKLDNRPTAFKVLPPLPTGFANVSVLKEHFSSYGDLNLVELEAPEHGDSSIGSEASNTSAHISFTTRHAAERAFSSAKCWQGHNLQFMWLAPNTIKANATKENPSAASRKSSDTINLSAGEFTATSFQNAEASETIESENLERRELKVENVDQDEDSKSRSTKISGEKQSP